MKLKVSDAYNIKMGIEKLSEEKLPVVISFRLQRLYQELIKVTKTADEEKNKIILKKGAEQDGKFVIERDSEEYLEFQEEYGKLLAEEFDIEVPEIPLSALGELELSIEVCLLLDKVFQDG